MDLNQIKSLPKNKVCHRHHRQPGRDHVRPVPAWPSPPTGRWRSSAGDRVIISASAIPGNENAIGKVINELYRKGAEVVYERAGRRSMSPATPVRRS